MKTIKIAFRLPCAIHSDCDETGVKLFHGRNYTSLTNEEKINGGHDFCEGDIPKIKQSLINSGKWQCECGFIHTLDDNRKLSPPLAILTSW